MCGAGDTKWAHVEPALGFTRFGRRYTNTALVPEDEAYKSRISFGLFDREQHGVIWSLRAFSLADRKKSR